MVNSFSYWGMATGEKATFLRSLFVPDESEISCGPSTKMDWVVYNLSTGTIVFEDEDEMPMTAIDSLFDVWKSATVARDTLYADTLHADSLKADTTESK